jgi:phosphohistidine phosphatase
MHLYIIRHAWAYHGGDSRWPDDSQRPLEPQGAKRMAQVVRLLAQSGFAPSVIATSPYARCRQTAEVVAAELSPTPTVVEFGALAPGSDLAALLAWSQAQQCEALAWVGHAPDVGYLAADLIGDGDASIRFAKGTVACLRFDGPIERGAGELAWLATAKLLGT